MTDCIEWKGAVNRVTGYGTLGSRYAHRISYERFVGPIPPGLTIDHLCRNRRCINPAHLEAVTIRVNVLRGTSPLAQKAKQTHCIHGHPLSGDNLYIRPEGRRCCRTCRRETLRRFFKNKRSKSE